MKHDMSEYVFFFFQAEDGIRDLTVTGVQTCALPISGAMFGTDWPFTIRAAPGSVLPTISAECPTTCVLMISRTISCDWPRATSVNLKMVLTSLVCFFPSVADRKSVV